MMPLQLFSKFKIIVGSALSYHIVRGRVVSPCSSLIRTSSKIGLCPFPVKILGSPIQAHFVFHFFHEKTTSTKREASISAQSCYVSNSFEANIHQQGHLNGGSFEIML
jgi:hypothetical protein